MTVPVGAKFGRIHRKTFPDPLGFGKNPSRFSDPRRRTEASRFGVLYLGSSLKVCFLETMLRDDRDGIVGQIAIAESELDDRRYAEIRVREALRLLDLTGDGPVRMGIPSDVASGRRQTLSRKWSVAFHEHPQQPDGIVYRVPKCFCEPSYPGRSTEDQFVYRLNCCELFLSEVRLPRFLKGPP